ncbi:hypothetical protein RFI_04783 [Reticulomyxa filosa]|uniref:C2H2-type domain-containing protein n=1 Tax=Reticulomyxa filosa TaxID=46433 RepID=X6P2M6_RETFI|nr:hypothetical protein RFI_04783 [Reticulomyxa filosa]|eukprot:ETO32334.1 hypothetical protein RFI_04783 [Reticulomyxa filosa]
MPWTHECPHCGKTFKNGQALGGHISRHRQAGKTKTGNEQRETRTHEEKIEMNDNDEDDYSFARRVAPKYGPSSNMHIAFTEEHVNLILNSSPNKKRKVNQVGVSVKPTLQVNDKRKESDKVREEMGLAITLYHLNMSELATYCDTTLGVFDKWLQGDVTEVEELNSASPSGRVNNEERLLNRETNDSITAKMSEWLKGFSMHGLSNPRYFKFVANTDNLNDLLSNKNPSNAAATATQKTPNISLPFALNKLAQMQAQHVNVQIEAKLNDSAKVVDTLNWNTKSCVTLHQISKQMLDEMGIPSHQGNLIISTAHAAKTVAASYAGIVYFRYYQLIDVKNVIFYIKEYFLFAMQMELIKFLIEKQMITNTYVINYKIIKKILKMIFSNCQIIIKYLDSIYFF